MNENILVKLIYTSIFILIITAYVITLHHGLIISPDGHFYLDAACNQLDINISACGNDEHITIIPKSYYIGFSYYIGAILIIFGEYWDKAVITLNFMFATLSVLILYIVAKNLSSLIGIILVGGQLLFSLDLYIWPRYLLPDTCFTLILAILCYYLAKILKGNVKGTHYILIIFFCILAVLIKPVSIIYITIFVFAMLTAINYAGSNLILLWIFMATLLITPLWGLVIYESDFQQPMLLIAKEYIYTGTIIHDRYSTDVSSLPILGKYFFVIWQRFLFYFQFFSKSFSKLHNIINIIYILPFALAFFNALKIKDVRVNNKYLVFSITSIIFIASFHALTLIDYDWRYRYDVFPIYTVMIVALTLKNRV